MDELVTPPSTTYDKTKSRYQVHLLEDVETHGYMLSLHHRMVSYMNRSRPATKHKCKPHVKVTCNHNILCGHPLLAQILHEQIIRHHTGYMSAIYGPYAILEVWIEPTVPVKDVFP
jgi:hypothetical protein